MWLLFVVDVSFSLIFRRCLCTLTNILSIIDRCTFIWAVGVCWWWKFVLRSRVGWGLRCCVDWSQRDWGWWLCLPSGKYPKVYPNFHLLGVLGGKLDTRIGLFTLYTSSKWLKAHIAQSSLATAGDYRNWTSTFINSFSEYNSKCWVNFHMC